MSARFGLGLAAAFAGGVAYGSNAPFATLAAGMGVPGADAVFWRAALMLALCLAFVVAMRRSLRVPPAKRGAVIGLGVTTTITSIAYLSSVAYIPVAIATVLFYTFPVIILLVSPMIDGERITLARLGVFAVAFLGVIIVVGPSFGGLDARGMLLAVIASVSAAGMFFAGRQVMTAVTPESAAVWVHIVILPLALLAVLAIGGPATLPATWAFAGIFAVIAGSYILGFLLQMVALRHIPAVVAGFVFLIEPVVAILTAAAVLGERLHAAQYLGCAVVLAALVASVLVERRELQRRSVPA
jgi:drug/metabolite transporter (DMT)-like permease